MSDPARSSLAALLEPDPVKASELELDHQRRRDAYRRSVPVTCEPCLGGDHARCTRPCVCRLRPT